MAVTIYTMTKFRYVPFTTSTITLTDSFIIDGREVLSRPSSGRFMGGTADCYVKRTARTELVVKDKYGNALPAVICEFDVPTNRQIDLSSSYVTKIQCYTFSDDEWVPTEEESAIEQLCAIEV